MTQDIFEQLENGTLTDKVIEIKSVYKNGKTTVTPIKDPFTGQYRGLERLSEDDKRKRINYAEPTDKFILKDGVTFDLNREEHKVTWNWIKHQPVLAESEAACQSRPHCEFYIHLRNREALERLSKRERRFKAEEYILKDNAAQYPMRIKLLGMNMDGEDPLIIKESLLDIAESSPDRIIAVYEDKMISIRMLLIAAVEKGVVKIDTSGAYRYGNTIMGMSEDTVISWLNESINSELLGLLEREVYPNHFKKEVVEEDKVSKPTPPSAPRE